MLQKCHVWFEKCVIFTFPPSAACLLNRGSCFPDLPQIILSWLYMANSWSARISKSRQVASSDPVAKACPEGKNATALMSDSWPGNVCLHWPSRTSHSYNEPWKWEKWENQPWHWHRRHQKWKFACPGSKRGTSRHPCGRWRLCIADRFQYPRGHWNYGNKWEEKE